MPVVLVTDLDAGLEAGSGVGQAEVFALFARNLERLKGLLTDTSRRSRTLRGAPARSWADGLDLTYDVPGTAS